MTEPYERLLAKSYPWSDRPIPSVTLAGHLRDVLQAVEAVLTVSGKRQLDVFGLSWDKWGERFTRVQRAAAAFHDLGKANDHFQDMIRRRRRIAQGLRHEWVTYLLLNQPVLKCWVQQLFQHEIDWYVMLWTISGHHPAHARPSPPRAADLSGGEGSDIQLLLGHDDSRIALDWIASVLSLPPPPQTHDSTASLVVGSGNAFAQIKKTTKLDRKVWEGMTLDEKRFAAACKACLIAGDVAGSALPQKTEDPIRRSQWVCDQLMHKPAPDELESLVQDRLGMSSERPFQTEVSDSRNRVTLVRAGCGSGKTVAAYLWSARQCAGTRMYFCYPTTGTTTEGFRDYLFESDHQHAKFGARLFHSRSEVDIEMILGVDELKDPDTDPVEDKIRVDSLSAWSTPIVCCTVDTVLGLLQNSRRGLFAWPALAQASFVFDEIHAYDNRLFGLLLRFIRDLRGASVLLMTASLPTERRDAIKQVLHLQDETLAQINGPAELEELHRYHRELSGDPVARVRQEIMENNGKVLWVSNTVDRAMAVADTLADCDPIIYHSRFRYEDRVHQHTRLINAFSDKQPALAVCTQVAEMSLDLSATLLVTDLAPVPSLIQRLGRLNRRAVPSKGNEYPSPTMPFILIKPRDSNGRFLEVPYKRDDDDYGNWPQQAECWLSELSDGKISQHDLARAWETLPDKSTVATTQESMWLDGGPETRVDSTREASLGITVIIEGKDSDAVQRGEKAAIEVALPMPPSPKAYEWEKWSRLEGFPIAPTETIAYDSNRGASWRKK